MDLAEIKVFEEQKVGTLKLSEAIRIGAKLRQQQCVGWMFAPGASCALGAAYEAVYGAPPLDYGNFNTVDPRTGRILDYHLSSVFGDINLHVEIFRRNDRGDTREAIADWLESKGL